MSLKLMLADEFEVEVANTPEAALEALGARFFDLVLCDVIMPGMNGLELHARVKVQIPSAAERFVFMTGGATTEAMARQLTSTLVPVVEKPFSPEALRELLRR